MSYMKEKLLSDQEFQEFQAIHEELGEESYLYHVLGDFFQIADEIGWDKLVTLLPLDKRFDLLQAIIKNQGKLVKE